MEEVAYHLRSRDVTKKGFPCPDSRRSKESLLVKEGQFRNYNKLDFAAAFSPKPESDSKLFPTLSEEENRKVNLKWRASWAKKALEYYNSKQHTNFKLVEVKIEKSRLCLCLPSHYLVHMNFTAESGDVDSLKWFFAELNVPLCMDKEDEMVVKECCIFDAENPNPKKCNICRNAVVHPLPR